MKYLYIKEVRVKVKTKVIINIFLSASFAGMFMMAACDDTLTNIDSVVIPSKNVSYSQHIDPVLQRKCAVAGCHDDQSRLGNLSLTSWANTTTSYLVVAPGLPQNSSLLLSVQGLTTNPMPPVGLTPFNQNQVEGLKTWIKEGAKNN